MEQESATLASVDFSPEAVNYPYNCTLPLDGRFLRETLPTSQAEAITEARSSGNTYTTCAC